MVYFLFLSFGEGIFPGVRSLAAVLLPLIIVTFMFIFQKRNWRSSGKHAPSSGASLLLC